MQTSYRTASTHSTHLYNTFLEEFPSNMYQFYWFSTHTSFFILCKTSTPNIFSIHSSLFPNATLKSTISFPFNKDFGQTFFTSKHLSIKIPSIQIILSPLPLSFKLKTFLHSIKVLMGTYFQIYLTPCRWCMSLVGRLKRMKKIKPLSQCEQNEYKTILSSFIMPYHH